MKLNIDIPVSVSKDAIVKELTKRVKTLDSRVYKLGEKNRLLMEEREAFKFQRKKIMQLIDFVHDFDIEVQDEDPYYG